MAIAKPATAASTTANVNVASPVFAVVETDTPPEVPLGAFPALGETTSPALGSASPLEFNGLSPAPGPIYTDFEPEILTSTGGYTYRKFFTGAISPFYTDSVEKHTDRMWYIGKHYTDDEGDPNVQGCGWFTYQNGLETGCFAADDTERTTCEIVDNGDGTHTIKGVMYDKTFDKSLRYEYKTEHPGIFSPNFG